jgi:hypothetical protein
VLSGATKTFYTYSEYVEEARLRNEGESEVDNKVVVSN